MNYQPVTLIVESSDGIKFAVDTDQRAIPYELARAALKTAEQLAAHGDFVRVGASLTEQVPRPLYASLDDLPDVTPIGQRILRALFGVAHQCDPSREALCRAQARWSTAAVVQGDKP